MMNRILAVLCLCATISLGAGTSTYHIVQTDGTNLVWLGGGITNAVSTSGLTSNTTVTITNGTPSAAIQAQIDAQPKNQNGNNLVFSFSAGTYTLTNSLQFNFFYGGYLAVIGPATSSTTNMIQSAILNGSSYAGVCLQFYGVKSDLVIQNLKMAYNNSSSGYGIFAQYCTDIRINYCWMMGAGTSGYGTYLEMCRAYGLKNVFTYGAHAMYVYNGSTLYSRDSINAVNLPGYGISSRGSVIYKQGSQSSGSTSDEYTQYGGQIY